MSGYDWSPLVEVLAGMGGLAARLLERHHDDGSGRCRLCGSGGQTGRYRWPCATRELAVLALSRQAELRLDRSTPRRAALVADPPSSSQGPRHLRGGHEPCEDGLKGEAAAAAQPGPFPSVDPVVGASHRGRRPGEVTATATRRDAAGAH